MPKPQQDTVDTLKTLGYEVVRDCLWPYLRHPGTGKVIQVSFDGRQIDAGWDRR